MAAKPTSDDTAGKDARIDKLDAEIDAVMARFGSQVRNLRKGRGITQQEIAARTGLTSGALSKIENGERSASMRSVLKVAAALEMQPSELVMLIDAGPRSNAASGTSFGVPVIIGPGVSSETIEQLARELDKRGAGDGKPARRVRRG